MAANALDQAQDDSRSDILSVAAGCFEMRGYAATSIDDVARKLGATKGRIYHHFASKTDLFAAVFRHGMAMNYAAIEPLCAADLPPLAKLQRLAEVHTRQMIDTKQFQRVVWEGVEMHLRGATTPEQREALDELLRSRNDYSEIFRAQMEAARDAGDLAFDSVSVANQLFFTALNSPIFWYSPRPGETDADVERLVRQIVTFALQGLGARMESPR